MKRGCLFLLAFVRVSFDTSTEDWDAGDVDSAGVNVVVFVVLVILD